MKIKPTRLKQYGILMLSVFLCVGLTQRVEAEQVKFTERYQLEQTRLELKSTAVLTWALLFDVYAGALYLSEDLPAAEWTDDVPKLLELSYFRNFKAEDFSRSSDQLLRENLSPEQYQDLAERLSDFYQLFHDISPGDRYSLVYQPTIGTELWLNGKPLGSVAGHDFAVAYFGLWLGPKPISESFRDRLLGDR